MHPCMHAYMHAYTHTRIHAYMHTCIHAYMHTCIHAYMHTCIHAYMHTCIHAYMHTCIQAYRHTGIHAYMHTGRHAGKGKDQRSTKMALRTAWWFERSQFESLRTACAAWSFQSVKKRKFTSVISIHAVHSIYHPSSRSRTLRVR